MTVTTRGNIRVELELVGVIRRPWPEHRRELELPAGTTVGTLLANLGYTEREARHLVIFVNGAKSKRAAALAAGDQVTVMLSIGGG